MVAPPPTCDVYLETSKIAEVPISGGLTLHHILLIVVGVLTFFTLCVSLTLMFQHATHYSRPWEQKHILRILLMLPIYAIMALAIAGFYEKYVYLTIVYQLYEPLAVVSYLTLLIHLVAPTQEQQDEWLESRGGKPWIFPISLLAKCTGGEKGPFRAPRVAKTQFEIIWFCVYQYCVVRMACSIIALVTEGFGKYCNSSLNPRYAHIWITIITSISVAVAMHNLIQAHWTVRKMFAHHGIHLKLLCIKLVVFFTFWQGIVFSLAGSKAAPKLNQYVSRSDVQIVFQYVTLSVELLIFALLHIKAYPVSAYKVDAAHPQYVGGTLGWRAFRDCFNFVDVGRAIYRGFTWMFIHRKNRKAIPNKPLPTIQDMSPPYMGDSSYTKEKYPVEVHAVEPNGR